MQCCPLPNPRGVALPNTFKEGANRFPRQIQIRGDAQASGLIFRKSKMREN